MSAPKPDGGWAFPVPMDSYSNCKGMTLRDWFAGMALQGSIAGDPAEKYGPKTHEEFAYFVADHMILARHKWEGGKS